MSATSGRRQRGWWRRPPALDVAHDDRNGDAQYERDQRGDPAEGKDRQGGSADAKGGDQHDVGTRPPSHEKRDRRGHDTDEQDDAGKACQAHRRSTDERVDRRPPTRLISEFRGPLSIVAASSTTARRRSTISPRLATTTMRWAFSTVASALAMRALSRTVSSPKFSG